MRQFYLYLLFFITINHLYPQSTTLALPENTIKKTLHTGFTYVVMPNNTPKNKVEIRLCLRVGSAQENKNNEGIAHFIEHLAFNGSKNYPNNQAIAFWESLGAKFGETINAYTTDDRTVYSISLSNINEEQLQKTIDILADWLYNMSITPENIEKEGRIIIEEIASYQPRKDLNPIKVGYDPHLSRLPIGSKEQVQKITQKDLLDFYQQYYTPQYATLIVVGDVATSSTVKSIENTFKTLLNKNELPAISTLNSVHFTEKPYFLATEKGKKGKDTLTLLYPKKYSTTHWREIVEDYTQKVVINLLKNRMKAANKEVTISNYWYLQQLSFTEIEITAKDIKEELKNTFSIIEGIKNNITQEEIDNVLAKVIQEIDQIPTQRTSSEWAMNFIDAFIFNEEFIATQQDKEKLINILQNLNLNQWQESCNTFCKMLNYYPLATTSPIAIYTTNEGNITYNEIQNLIAEGKKTPITITPSFAENTSTAPIASPAILTNDIAYSPSMITEETYFSTLKIHRIKLSNGATIYFKPTQNDNTLNISLLFKGGYALLPKKEFKLYEDLLSYIHIGGIQSFTGDLYEEFLYQNNLSFIIGTEAYHHLAMATAPVSESKLLCNLIQQKLQHPALDFENFELLKQEELQSSLQKHSPLPSDPIRLLDFKIEALKQGFHTFTSTPKTTNDILNTDLETLHHYYQKHFLSANGLLCVVTGNFNVKDVKNNLVGMLSTLSSTLTTTIVKEKKKTIPSFKTLKAPQNNNRTAFTILYTDTYEKGLKGTLSAKLFCEIVRKAVISEIREKNGWIYSPYVGIDLLPHPSPKYYLTISGETDKNNLKKIEKEVKKIINTIKKREGNDSTFLNDIKKTFIINKNEALSDENAFQWRNYLIDCFKNDISLEELSLYEEILESIR